MVLISHPSPSLLVFLLWILVYKMRPGMGLTFFMFLIRLDCLFRSGLPQRSPVFQIAVIPFEIDVPRHVNLDDRAGPPNLLFSVLAVLPVLSGFWLVKPDVVFEQLDVIFANRRSEQLAKICQGSMKIFRFADLLRIDDRPHPSFAYIGALLDQPPDV